MSDALEDHDGKVSVGERNVTNLRFVDEIAALAQKKSRTQDIKWRSVLRRSNW